MTTFTEEQVREAVREANQDQKDMVELSRLKEIATAVEEEYQMGGLSDGIYFEFACEVATRFAKSEHQRVIEEEYKRCVDVLDFDHNECSRKETCIGYQNAQSDLMNNPPKPNDTQRI